jgi:membrane protein DedA with SNARE-associated domain
VGYAAIVAIVLLGNAGVPTPEESVLVPGSYLARHGRLHLPLVILVGVAILAVPALAFFASCASPSAV